MPHPPQQKKSRPTLRDTVPRGIAFDDRWPGTSYWRRVMRHFIEELSRELAKTGDGGCVAVPCGSGASRRDAVLEHKPVQTCSDRGIRSMSTVSSCRFDHTCVRASLTESHDRLVHICLRRVLCYLEVPLCEAAGPTCAPARLPFNLARSPARKCRTSNGSPGYLTLPLPNFLPPKVEFVSSPFTSAVGWSLVELSERLGTIRH